MTFQGVRPPKKLIWEIIVALLFSRSTSFSYIHSIYLCILYVCLLAPELSFELKIYRSVENTWS